MAQKNFFRNFLAMAIMVLTTILASCTDEGGNISTTSVNKPNTDDTTVVVKKGAYAKNYLTHNFDTVTVEKNGQIKSDNMVAKTTIYTTEDGEVVDSVTFSKFPSLKTSLTAEKDDYNIAQSQIAVEPISTNIIRSYADTENGNMEERDTVVISLNDGNVLKAPVYISTEYTDYHGNRWFHASDTLLTASFAGYRNVPVQATTRAAYVSQSYNTEFTVRLDCTEKNVSPKNSFPIYLKVWVKRNLLSEDAIDSVYAANKQRVIIDETTERCSFDEVIVMKSGEKTVDSKSIILNRAFKGIDAYDKYVSAFNYAYAKTNGLVDGGETAIRTDGGWNVWGRTDKYSSDIANGFASEVIVTDYALYHERTTYKDDFLTVEFGYEDIKVNETTDKVTDAESDKENYVKAIYTNGVDASYMTWKHSLLEEVNLYKRSKIVTGHEIREQQLTIEDDKVIASLVYVTTYADGSEETEAQEKEFPRSLVCTTDWTAKESNSTASTGAAEVNLKSSNAVGDGFWSYVSETRVIKTTARLNTSTQQNGWTSIDPNSISYTRNGESYSFDAIEFNAKETGSTVVFSSTSNSVTTYKYTDNLSVIFGDNTVATTAPGKILVNGKAVVGYETRDENLVVTDDNVTASLTYVVKYLDGTEDKEAVSKSFPRSLVCTTDWTSYENNAGQTTGSPSVAVKSSEEITDGDWSYLKETRTITSVATLAASQQQNGWTSIDPNSIVFIREGASYEFQKLRFEASYVSAAASLNSTVGLTETYKYGNTIAVKFGDTHSKTSTAPGTIIVQKAKEVTGHEIRDPKLTVDDNKVTATLTYITKYNDGTETTESVSKSFPRSLVCNTNWTVNSTNSNPFTSSATVSLKSSDSRTDGFWSYANETYTITTTANFNGMLGLVGDVTADNGWTAIVPNSIVYTRDGESYSFTKLLLYSIEKGASVSKSSETDTEIRYGYTDKISVSYGENTIESTAPGTIVSTVYVMDYEIRDTNLKVSNADVTASLTFVTKYSNGTEKTEQMSKTVARSLLCLSSWESTEENSNQQTGSASVELNNSTNEVDGYWSYVVETRTITTPAHLNASTQNNIWKSVDPNNFVFTREGKTYSFGAISFSASENGANVVYGSENDDWTTYNYTDNLSVLFGGNIIGSTATGIINVAKVWTPDFPAEWGKFVSATATVAQNEGVEDWVYTWSLHFEKGTLPVIVDKNATTASIDQSLFEYDTNSRLNGAVYSGSEKRWKNAIAADQSGIMLWFNTNEVKQRALLMSTAAKWGWNNGTNSVFTSAFGFSVSNGILTVTKNGSTFATFKVMK